MQCHQMLELEVSQFSPKVDRYLLKNDFSKSLPTTFAEKVSPRPFLK